MRIGCLLLCLLLLSGLAAAERQAGSVSWIYDGDTLRVEGVGKVRLLGIDTPESSDSSRDRYYRQQYKISTTKLRAVAARVKQFNIRQVKGKRVRLEFDREPEDRYGRKLAYLYLPDGRMLNRLLLEKGWATVFRRFEFKYKENFLAAEATARSKRRGLWSE